ncbi:hypothetical protein EJ110_NYTH36053 [Nymphaea thermarum]|nr:hypothetical protein EJ110_NYTH36053 [Nymphaea thermarum]
MQELVRCTDGRERKLLEETRRLVGGEPEGGGHGDQEVRARVRDGLWSLGFNASICTSKWDQTPRCPPGSSLPISIFVSVHSDPLAPMRTDAFDYGVAMTGQHEYIDIVIDEAYPRTPAAPENRIIIDVDFRSEFEVARCTRHYAAILRNLPEVFVGRQDRLRRLVTVVSDAAVKSLRRKGMHVAPWRRPEYMLRKWFSPVVRRGRPGRPPRVSPSPLAEFVFDHQVGGEEADDDEEEEEDVEEEWEEEEEEEEDEDEERAWRTPAFPPRVFRGKVGPWALA